MNFKPLNDMVLIEPMEEVRESKIFITKNEATHRKGKVVAICENEKFLAVGDVVRYTDSFKTVKLEKEYHIVEKDGVYFKLKDE